ncbi:MAG: hypothetical protein ABI047_05185 [Jatrophihabitantaceae bacterium]
MRSSTDAGPLCRQLTAGEGPAVLVADFQAFNGAPRLGQLLSDTAAGQRVYQLEPLGALSGERLYASLQEMADESAAAFCSFEASEATDQRVFVVGHCGATGLGMRIANLLAGAREVTAILVQPSWPGTEHVAARFAEFQGKLGADSSPCPDLEGDPWDCVAGIEKIFRAGLVELAAQLDLDPDHLSFTTLLGTYRGWVSFLLACRNDQPAQAPSDAVTVSVLTDEPDFVLPGTSPGRCRVTPPPPLDRPDAVTPELAKLVLDQITSC